MKRSINVKLCLFLAYLSIAVPLLAIGIAILLSGWFDIVNNALSDLGHAIKSPVAPIFNFGLSLGGALILYLSAICLYKSSKLFFFHELLSRVCLDFSSSV